MKFNKKMALTTAKNVVIGGAANAAVDAAVQSVEAFSSIKEIDPMYVNLGKIALGAAVGAMTSNSWARAAADGLATVGASDLAKSAIEKYITPKPATGVPFIGRVRMGQRGFRRAAVRGTGAIAGQPFMSK